MRALAIVAALLMVGCAAAPIRDPAALDRYALSVTTADGWTLAVFRVPPAPGTEGLPGFGIPVLMPHGTSVNRMNYMSEGADLAGYLASRGYDVWVPEHRGDRTSRDPGDGALRQGRWSIDDIAEQDMPAVLDRVLEETGRDRLFWVGHSLGGILGYIAAEGPLSPKIAGLVTLGSPGAYVHPSRWAQQASRSASLLPRAGQVPSRGLGLALRPVLDFAPDGRLLHVVFNAVNVDPPGLIRFVGRGMENIGRGMVEQYLRWLREGTLTSLDRQRDYSAGLSSIRQPALILAGRVDQVVPAWTARWAYEHLGSQDKTWGVLGVGWGQEADYGHGDLLLGIRAEEEVFPRVADWLDAHVSAAAPRAP